MYGSNQIVVLENFDSFNQSFCEKHLFAIFNEKNKEIITENTTYHCSKIIKNTEDISNLLKALSNIYSDHFSNIEHREGFYFNKQYILGFTHSNQNENKLTNFKIIFYNQKNEKIEKGYFQTSNITNRTFRVSHSARFKFFLTQNKNFETINNQSKDGYSSEYGYILINDISLEINKAVYETGVFYDFNFIINNQKVTLTSFSLDLNEYEIINEIDIQISNIHKKQIVMRDL